AVGLGRRRNGAARGASVKWRSRQDEAIQLDAVGSNPRQGAVVRAESDSVGGAGGGLLRPILRLGGIGRNGLKLPKTDLAVSDAGAKNGTVKVEGQRGNGQSKIGDAAFDLAGGCFVDRDQARIVPFSSRVSGNEVLAIARKDQTIGGIALAPDYRQILA